MKRVITDDVIRYNDQVICTHSYKVDKTTLSDESLLRAWYKKCFRDFLDYEDWFVDSFLGINNLQGDEELRICLAYSEIGSFEDIKIFAVCEKYCLDVTRSSIEFRFKTNPNESIHWSYIPEFRLDRLPMAWDIRAVNPKNVIRSSNEIRDRITFEEEPDFRIFPRLVPHIVNEGLDEIVKHPTGSVLKHIKTVKAETDDYTPKSL